MKGPSEERFPATLNCPKGHLEPIQGCYHCFEWLKSRAYAPEDQRILFLAAHLAEGILRECVSVAEKRSANTVPQPRLASYVPTAPDGPIADPETAAEAIKLGRERFRHLNPISRPAAAEARHSNTPMAPEGMPTGDPKRDCSQGVSSPPRGPIPLEQARARCPG